MTYNEILQFCQNLSKSLIAQMVCLCLTLVVLWQLYSGSVTLLALQKTTGTRDTQQIVGSTVSNQNMTHAGLTQYFFGEYIPKAIDDAGVKESMLNVKVVGVLFAIPESDSQVILKIETGREQTFGIGDTVPGGAVIKRITNQGVLVERKGAIESLTLPKNELIFEAQAKPLVGE